MSAVSPSPRWGKRIRIFLGEADTLRGQSLYRVILERVQQQGASGATVFGGIEGFGPSHHLSAERLPDISDNLPLMIEIVESQECVERLLPVLDQLVQRGTITVTPVEIVFSGREP
jgi:PII-like signaling protein